MDVITVADRLYGIDFLPQELALHGSAVEFTLRYSPIFDDPAEVTATHFTVLVVEVTATVPGEGGTTVRRRLLRAGWELERTTAIPCPVGSLPERPEDVRLLLERIADTINDLARRAGLPIPLDEAMVAQLLHHYRTKAS